MFGLAKKICAVGLLLFVLQSQLFAQCYVEDSVKISGNMRHYVMVFPENMKENAPLVMCLHGYGGGINKNFYMVDAAKKHGFALCIPEGLRDPEGNRGWNVGYPMQQNWKVNDVKDVPLLTRYVQKKYHLSKTNAFLTGMSNGGDYCYALAHEGQKTFRAMAPVAGLAFSNAYTAKEGNAAIPLFEIHGTEDRVSEWTGDVEGKGGWGPYVSVPIAVNYWVAKAHCTHEVVKRVDGLNPANGHYVIQHKYLGGKDGIEVWLYEVVGAGHAWHTEDLNTGEEIWSFFSKYVR